MIFRRAGKGEGSRRARPGNATRRAHNRGEFLTYVRDRRTWIVSAVLVAAIAIAAGSVATVEFISQADRFPVRSVRFEGEFANVSQAELAQAVIPYARGNFFLLDLETVRRRALQSPWVRQASVRRVWPDGVYVHFSEHRLVARWGTQHWLNSYGEVVDLGAATPPAGLPWLAGPPGTQAQVLATYTTLNDMAKNNGLDIARLELSARRTWEAQLSNNLSILLGRGTPQSKLARFMAVYSDTLANRIQQIKQVDLRYTNGFSIQWVRAPAVGANEG